MATAQDVKLKLSGRDGLLSAIPSILGNHPTDSVVLAFFVAGGNVLGPVVRFDLADAQGADGAAPGYQMAGFAQRNNLDRVIVVLYTDDADVLNDIDPMLELLSSCGVELRDLFVAPNAPAALDSGLVAAYALSGRGVMADREAVARSVEYSGASLDDASAELLGKMGKLSTRDAMMARTIADTDMWLPLLITAAQSTPDGDARSADLLAVLAATAYRAGDGVLANVAFDRTVRINPDHRLAALLMQVITACLPPVTLDAMVAGL